MAKKILLTTAMLAIVFFGAIGAAFPAIAQEHEETCDLAGIDQTNMNVWPVYLKKLSTGEKVCVTNYAATKLIEMGYGVYYYDLKYVKIEGTSGRSSPDALVPPLLRTQIITLYDVDDIHNESIKSLKDCKKTEIGSIYNCTAYWKNGTKSKITPDFDLRSIFGEVGGHLSPLDQLNGGVPTDYITCKDGKVLMEKSQRPYCVNPGSVEELEMRGWNIV